MQRIEAFLAEDEVPKWASSLTASESGPAPHDIGFAAATFQWQVPPQSPSVSARFELGPLDVLFPEGKLTLISGATGSGKTAMLLALLGGQSLRRPLMRFLFTSWVELHCIDGHVLLDKSRHQVAYCAQNPCEHCFYSTRFFSPRCLGLEHATIRDNIIFGAAYGFDETRYQSVIEACALVRDLEVFDAGDMTGT